MWTCAYNCDLWSVYFKIMDEIKILTNKYAQYNVQRDRALPYKYLPDIIKELTTDILKINIIIERENDTFVIRECDLLKVKLNSRLNENSQWRVVVIGSAFLFLQSDATIQFKYFCNII